MANELLASFVPGRTCYFMVWNRVGQIWNVVTPAFENYLTADIANYAIPATQLGSSSSFYVGTFPTTIVAGVYSVVMKNQTGGSPAETDGTVDTGNLQWNGTVQLPLSDMATSGQVSLVSPVKVYRGEMVVNFPIKLVSSADHVTPFVSGVVSGQIARDGGVFGPLQSGNITEMGHGWYGLSALTSGDLFCNTAALLFTANGISGGTSDQRDYSFILQRVSGST